MAKNTANQTPRFTIAKPAKVSTALCKLIVPRTSIDNLTTVINDLLTQASKAGHKPKVIKGVLTLF